jgi:hypothetical protein
MLEPDHESAVGTLTFAERDQRVPAGPAPLIAGLRTLNPPLVPVPPFSNALGVCPTTGFSVDVSEVDAEGAFGPSGLLSQPTQTKTVAVPINRLTCFQESAGTRHGMWKAPCTGLVVSERRFVVLYCQKLAKVRREYRVGRHGQRLVGDDSDEQNRIARDGLVRKRRIASLRPNQPNGLIPDQPCLTETNRSRPGANDLSVGIRANDLAAGAGAHLPVDTDVERRSKVRVPHIDRLFEEVA